MSTNLQLADQHHLNVRDRARRDIAALPVDVLNAISGATAGFVSSIVTCPLDVVKTRLQAQSNGSHVLAQHRAESALSGGSGVVYRGMVGSLRTIWRNEGIRGWYRGLGALMIGYLPTWTIYFMVYEKCKKVYIAPERSQMRVHVMSAMTAGACSTIVTSPIWVVKTRLMTQSIDSSSRYRSTLHAFTQMYRHEGKEISNCDGGLISPKGCECFIMAWCRH